MIAHLAKGKKEEKPLVFKLDSKQKAKFCEKKIRSDDVEQAS